MSRPQFGSRLAMMLAMLGMAVGTGNIWRFPRIAAQNGGGEFLIAWVIFLLLWSVPLILLEFAMGRHFRSGPVRAFGRMMGPSWAWMGAFGAFVGVAILFYYSVVAGWTFRYALAAITGEVPGSRPGAFWREYTSSYWPIVTHGAAMGIGTYVVGHGVKAIERVAKILMPTLIVLVLVLTARAVTLPGASDGLDYLFSVDWSRLGEARLWVEALTQNAWDTGAGWGLVLCYAAYLRDREDTALNAFVLPVANNAISLLAGVMVLCTVFSVVPQMTSRLVSDPQALLAFPALDAAVRGGAPLSADLIQTTIFASSNEGLTFVWMPQLFATLPMGRVLMVLFFLSLSFAAITSLIAMVELGTRVLVDAGVSHLRAVRLVGSVGFVMGLPSAISLRVLGNQDWVWGVALLLAGLFFAVAAISHGVRRLREEDLNHEDSDIRIGRWWDVVIGFVVPVEAVVLLVWWLYQAWSWDPEGWLDPFAVSSVGTVLVQFAIVLSVLIASNGWLVKRSLPDLVEPRSPKE